MNLHSSIFSVFGYITTVAAFFTTAFVARLGYKEESLPTLGICGLLLLFFIWALCKYVMVFKVENSLLLVNLVTWRKVPASEFRTRFSIPGFHPKIYGISIQHRGKTYTYFTSFDAPP